MRRSRGFKEQQQQPDVLEVGVEDEVEVDQGLEAEAVFKLDVQRSVLICLSLPPDRLFDFPVMTYHSGF